MYKKCHIKENYNYLYKIDRFWKYLEIIRMSTGYKIDEFARIIDLDTNKLFLYETGVEEMPGYIYLAYQYVFSRCCDIQTRASRFVLKWFVYKSENCLTLEEKQIIEDNIRYCYKNHKSLNNIDNILKGLSKEVINKIKS